MVAKRGRMAWLVTWVTANRQHLESPIAAMFSSRKSPETTRDYVEFLYLTKHFGGDEQLSFLADPTANPYPATYGTIRANVSGTGETNLEWRYQVMCGHNPYLYARRVKNLRLGAGTYPDGSQRLEWDEIPKPAEPLDWT